MPFNYKTKDVAEAEKAQQLGFNLIEAKRLGPYSKEYAFDAHMNTVRKAMGKSEVATEEIMSQPKPATGKKAKGGKK